LNVSWSFYFTFPFSALLLFKTLSQDTTACNANVMYHVWKLWSCTFSGKNPPCPRLAQLSKLRFKLKNFFQPAGFFTEMLRFDKKIQRNFSEISLQPLKLLSIKKRGILEKSRKNKIFIISGFNEGHRDEKSRPASRLCLKYSCPTL
jgi:hypothetical protein